ncbi:unnamed protein product [Schistocephalus solidus]|uniref:DHC_N1 domain-containing protein n=1 Tax=Schistocephalus solidus TaxID=70667 RepID=A0A183S8H4_SCHSO|nr:unnamed protein product [Schistocephalus solidus]
MGNILRLLTSRSEEIKDDVDIFVDFENCQPSEEEYDLWLEINEKLAHTDDVLHLVQNYPGAAAEIRAAIERFSDANAQLQAWKALSPLVQQLRFCYDFGVELAQTIPRLLHALCSDELTVWEHLESQQALFKQFAEILDFIMKFDDLKVSDDGCMRRADDLTDEYCSKMSLFYAEATPMLKLVGRYTTQYQLMVSAIPFPCILLARVSVVNCWPSYLFLSNID